MIDFLLYIRYGPKTPKKCLATSNVGAVQCNDFSEFSSTFRLKNTN